MLKQKKTLQDQQLKQIKHFIFSTKQPIGKGYSSTVYHGTNTNNQSHVAIKAIQLKNISNQIQKKLFNNEIKALKTLEYPYVLKALDMFQTSNNFYLITQFYQSTLEAEIKAKKAFSEKQILRFIEILCQVLCYLEQKNIVHRDIKPSNIFIKADQYILGDFGFCSFRNPYKLEPQQVYYNIGSPLYMSPEAYKNSLYSIKSDIWSLGICIIEIILGEQPFKGLTYDQMISLLLHGRFIDGLEISNLLKSILKRIFILDPLQRIFPSEILRMIMKFNDDIVLGIQSNQNLSPPKQTTSFKKAHSRKASDFDCLSKPNKTHSRRFSEKQNCKYGESTPKNNSNCNSLTKPVKNGPSVPINSFKKHTRDKSLPKLETPANKYPSFHPFHKIILAIVSDPAFLNSLTKIKVLKLLLTISPPFQRALQCFQQVDRYPVTEDYLYYILNNTKSQSWGQYAHYLIFLLKKLAHETCKQYNCGILSKQNTYGILKSVYQFYMEYQQEGNVSHQSNDPRALYSYGRDKYWEFTKLYNMAINQEF